MHNDQPQNPEELSMDAILARESIELYKAEIDRKDAEIASRDAEIASKNAEIESMALRFLRSLQGKSDAEIMQSTGWTQERLDHYRALSATT